MRNCTDAAGELATVAPRATGPADAAKVARLKRILFVFSRESSFIAIDRALLEERWARDPVARSAGRW